MTGKLHRIAYTRGRRLEPASEWQLELASRRAEPLLRKSEFDQRRCHGCAYMLHLDGDGLCIHCATSRAEGRDWKPVFDRDTGKGRIPENLRARYGDV
jgi:hypothetical protein